MPFDSANALAGILIAGGICVGDANVAELDTGIHRACRFYEFRRATKLNKRQSVALDDYISKRPEETLRYIETECRDDWLFFLELLNGKQIDANRLKGRPVAPETRLLIDLTMIYFRLKATNKLGEDGPHYRFVEACLKHAELPQIIPRQSALPEDHGI